MPLFTRFTQGHLGLTRLEAFSDGVFAIVVTLLVLELKVPAIHDHASVGELAEGLLEEAPKFFSWLISFIIVCKFWLNHHHIISQASHANYGLIWLNALFLMGQSFIPFPTALMGEYHQNPLAVSLFGCVFALNTLIFLAEDAYIRHNLLKPELADAQIANATLKGMIGSVFYLLGAAAAWVNVYAAFGLYLITPIFYLTPPTRKGGKGGA